MKFSALFALSAVAGVCQALPFNDPIPWTVTNFSIYQQTNNSGGMLTFNISDPSAEPRKFETTCNVTVPPQPATLQPKMYPCDDSSVDFGVITFQFSDGLWFVLQHNYQSSKCNTLEHDKADIPCADFAVTDLFTYDSAEPQDASDGQDEILVFHLDSMVIYPVREMNSSSIVGKLS